MTSAFHLDGRGALPWLLLIPYLWPLALFPLAGGGSVQDSLSLIGGLLAAAAVLAAFGPLFVALFLIVSLGIWARQTPYLGDCRSMGEEMIFYFPMALALPGACLLTSRLMYYLGRETVPPDSRRLGNITFPFVGFLYATAVIAFAQYRIDWALKHTDVCGGG